MSKIKITLKFIIIVIILLNFNFRKLLPHNTESLNFIDSNFQNILLIINFNQPHYSNINFLKQIYGTHFKHIKFYGEKTDVNVISVDTNGGYLLSRVVSDALKRFPTFDGYLFLQDDCVLNYWNIIYLNLNKIWYTVKFNDMYMQNLKFFSIKNFNGDYSGIDWGAWHWPCCLKAARLAYINLSYESLTNLHINIGKDNIPLQMCEMFFIPKRFKDQAINLCDILQDVFCEISITMMMCCLDLIQNWEHLNMFAGNNLYDKKDNLYLSKFNWFHPIKFSDQSNREKTIDYFNNVNNKIHNQANK